MTSPRDALLARFVDSATAPSWPLPGWSALSSRFGWRTNPVTGKRQQHAGIDIPAPSGTAVRSATAGTVSRVDQDGVGRGEVNGNAVLIRTPGGTQTWAYLHLYDVAVRPGDRVTQGTVVGRVGMTGRATGPHLHLQVSTAEGPVDPLPLFQRAPASV